MAVIFKLDGLAFIANVGWHAVEGTASRYRLGKVCIAEIERRRAILGDHSFDGLPILADYVGRAVHVSRRALVVLLDDSKENYFVGDFFNGIVNINTDLFVSKEHIEGVIEAKLSEMGYSSPDIFINIGLELNILEGFNLKTIEFDNNLIDNTNRASLIGVPWYMIGTACVVLALFIFGFSGVSYLTQKSPEINTGNQIVTTRITDHFVLDWVDFNSGCEDGLQRSFPRIAGWMPGTSGCFTNTMKSSNQKSDIKLSDNEGVAWIFLSQSRNYNTILSNVLLMQAAHDFGFSPVIEGDGAFIYWRFPISYKPFSLPSSPPKGATKIYSFIERKFGFELLNIIKTDAGVASSVQARIELPMQEFFRRLSGDNTVELNGFTISQNGIVTADFVHQKPRKTAVRIITKTLGIQ